MSDIIESIASKFRSGNDVPVDSARITAQEWSALLAHIQRGAVPEGYDIAPAFLGYALLGIGQYVLHNCPRTDDASPSLVIAIATEDEKAGRQVGELQESQQGEMIHPDRIAVRIDFQSVAALDALEQQLRFLREDSFPDSLAAPAPDQFRDAAKMMAEPAEVPMTQAATDVLAERQRQISAEGWTPDHDDEHDDGSLAAAAACYALGGQAGEIPAGWPQSWDDSWWRPSAGERRNLVKAGALILAEIERLDRADAASRKTSWLCPNCPTPDLCLRIQGCDRDEIAR